MKANNLKTKKLKLNKFKKIQPNKHSINKPKVPQSAFHIYCKRVKNLNEQEKEKLFGNLNALTQVQQVQKIRETWHDMSNEDPLKKECFEEFKAQLLKFHSSKQEYAEKMNALQENGESTTIYVGNLPLNVTENCLKELFESVGKVVGVRIKQFKSKKSCSSFGFCEFDNIETAKLAVKGHHGKIWKEKELDVKLSFANI